MIIIFQTVMLPMLIAQLDFYWVGTTSSNPSEGLNWQDGNGVPGTAPTIVVGVIADYLTIRSGTYYPIFSEDIIVGDGANSTQGTITVNAGASIKFEGDLAVDPDFGLLTILSTGSGNGKLIFNDPYTSPPYATVKLYLTGLRYHYFVPPVSSMILWSTSALTNTRTALGLGGTIFTNGLANFIESKTVATKEDGWQWYDGYNGTTRFKSINSSTGYNIYLNSSAIITFKGYLDSRDKTFNLSYTSGNAGAGWNLIGNLYPCNYDLSGISALMTDNDDINNYVYYNKDGGYVYWNPKDGTGSDGCSDIIPPMQGFFVHALSSGKSVTLPTSFKTFSTAQARTKGAGSSTKSVTTKKIKLVLNSPSQSDETMVGVFDDATLDFNQNHDANKMFNTDPSPYIYSEINGVDYFMKSISAPSSQPIEVPLKVVLTESGSHTIKITEFDNMEAYKITLKHGDIQVPLTAGTIYNFNSNPGTYSDYSLVFNSILTGVDNPNETLLKTWYRNNYLYINYPSDFKAGNSEINIYDFNGRKVFGNKNLDITPGETKQIQVSLQKGFYLTEIITGLKQYKSKIVVY